MSLWSYFARSINRRCGAGCRNLRTSWQACCKRFKSVRLGRIRSVPTVNEKFLKAHRMPGDIDQLKRHRLILLDRPISHQIISRAFPGVAQEEVVRLRTNHSMVQLSAVPTGGGFAWIPTYMHAVLRSLRVCPLARFFPPTFGLLAVEAPTMRTSMTSGNGSYRALTATNSLGSLISTFSRNARDRSSRWRPILKA